MSLVAAANSAEVVASHAHRRVCGLQSNERRSWRVEVMVSWLSSARSRPEMAGVAAALRFLCELRGLLPGKRGQQVTFRIAGGGSGPPGGG
eukprot:6223202-Pyramimonas_sp.AAC.1